MAAERIERYERKGTFSVSNVEKSILNNFRKFLGGSDIYFHEINNPLIEKFKVFCKGELGHKPRTITNHLIIIRTLFNLAIKEGIVDRKYYPFAGDNVKNIFTKTRTAARRFNKYLKKIAEITGIEKNLSNHIARPSFDNIAGAKINPLMLQKLYRHSNLKTTINYQANFIHKEADDALDAVVDF